MININSDQYHRLSLSPLCEHSWDNNIEPLVSICSITYNHGPYIKECLEGFLMQKTTFPVEILIHDDASTDGTEEIIREYEARYPEIIKPLYEVENQWIKGRRGSAVFNFPRAQGKYIALCEGDDYWTDPLKLQKQVDFLEGNSEYSMCFHNANLLYEDDNHLNRPFRDIETREYSGQEILRVWTIPTASVVFRTQAYVPIFHPDFMFGDIILFLSLAENGKIMGMSDIMSVYRKHDGGVTSPKNANLSKALKFVKHHEAIKKVFGAKYDEVESEILSKAYIGLSIKQLKNFKLGFISSLLKAYKQKPSLFFKHLSKANIL